jgi:hypothetical protein
MKMRPLKLNFIVFGIFLLGCHQTDSKNTVVKQQTSTDTINGQPKKIADNEKLKDDQIDAINNVIALFKEKDIDKISGIIRFPLNRQYPIPPINDKKEFIQRFSEVFDQILIDKIANSKIEQWSEAGWRGLMLDQGALWMANSDGIITTVNHQSDLEKKLRSDLIAREKENLHNSLKSFESPTHKIETKNYLIRIDELAGNKYRYASWKTGEKETSKPDLILSNGELEFEGSGGNYVINFVQGKYTYKIYRNVIGEENSPEITLNLEKEGKVILTEGGTLIM